MEKSKDEEGTQVHIEVEQAEVLEPSDEQEGLNEPETGVEVSPEARLINEAVIGTSAKVIGRVVALITRIPEMDFTEEEVEQLKLLWTPLVPAMSPVVGAIIGTTVIVAGKVAIYASKRKEVVKGGKPFTDIVPEDKERAKTVREQNGKVSEPGDTRPEPSG